METPASSDSSPLDLAALRELYVYLDALRDAVLNAKDNDNRQENELRTNLERQCRIQTRRFASTPLAEKKWYKCESFWSIFDADESGDYTKNLRRCRANALKSIADTAKTAMAEMWALRDWGQENKEMREVLSAFGRLSRDIWGVLQGWNKELKAEGLPELFLEG